MPNTLPDATALGGMPSAASGRQAVRYDTTAIGQGVAAFGNDVVKLADTVKAGWNKAADSSAYSDYLAFKAGEDSGLVDQSTNIDPAASQGFAAKWNTGSRDRGIAFLNTIQDPAEKVKFGNQLFQDFQTRAHGALTFEQGQQTAWFKTNVGKATNTLQQQIVQQGPAAFDGIMSAGDKVIADSGLSPADKQAFTDKWHQDASITRFKTEALTNPAQAAKDFQDWLAAKPEVNVPASGARGLSTDTAAAIDKAAAEAGLPAATLRAYALIESGGNAGSNPGGKYQGLFQLGADEFAKGGGGNILDANANAHAAAVNLKEHVAAFQAKFGRAPAPVELYLMHQQGEAGAFAHLANPGGVAWQNVRKFYPSDAVAKDAIWGNVPDDVKKQFPGGVDSLTSGDFTRIWANKVDRFGGGSAPSYLNNIPPDQLPGLITTAKNAQIQQHDTWLNNTENSILDGKFGVNDVTAAYNSGALTDANERQKLLDMIQKRDKDAVTLADITGRMASTGPGSYVFSSSNADDKKAVKTWYDAAAPDGGQHLLDQSEPDLVGGAESAVGRQAQGNPNGASNQAQAAAVYAVKRSGIVPPQVVDQLQSGMRSADAGLRGRAFDFMSALTQNYPSAVSQGFTEADQKLLERYSSLAEMMTPDELTKALNPADPQTRAIHDQFVSDAAKLAPTIDFLGADVFKVPGWFGTKASPAAPTDGLQAAKFERDATSIFTESYADTYGDVDKAKRLTAVRLGRKWGPTELGTGGAALMAYPPERYALPAPDGTFHWMDHQLEMTVKGAAPTATAWGVSEAPSTETEAKSGQQPHYLIWYTKDGVTSFITGADGKPQPKRFDQSETARLSAADVVAKQVEFAAKQAADIARQDTMAAGGDPNLQLPAGGEGKMLVAPEPGVVEGYQSTFGTPPNSATTLPGTVAGNASVPPDGSYADHWKPTTFNAPDAPGFDPKKPTAYRDQFGEWSVPDANDYKGSVAPQDLEKMFAKSAPKGGGYDFTQFGNSAVAVQALVEGAVAASGRTPQQVLDDPQYRATIIDKGWATGPQLDRILSAPRPRSNKDARVQDAAGQYGLPGVAPSDSPIGAVANIGGAVVGAAQNVWNGFTGSRVVQQFMDGWDNPQGINRKGKGDKLPVGPLPATAAAMSTAVEDFSDRKTFGAAYERYFQAPPTEGLSQEMIVAAAQRAQAKDAAAKNGKAVSGGVEGLNAFLNLMLIINQGIATSDAKKAGH